MSLLCVTWLASCEALQPPDARARAAVERLAARGFSLPVPGAEALEVPAGTLSHNAITAEPAGSGRLLAFGQLSLEGRLGAVPVSYLGSERFEVVCEDDCEVDGPAVGRLVEVLATLQARRRALADGGGEALAELAARRYRDERGGAETVAGREVEPPAALQAWRIRVDRTEAVVGESSAAGDRRLLLAREDERWRFLNGLP